MWPLVVHFLFWIWMNLTCISSFLVNSYASITLWLHPDVLYVFIETNIGTVSPPLATSFVGFFITHIHIHSNSFSSLSPGICWYLWVLILRQIFILRWWLLYTLANPFQRFCEKLAGNDEKCSYNTREVHIRLRQGWGTQGLEGRCYPK